MSLSQYSNILSLSSEEITAEILKIEKKIFDLRFKKATRQSYKFHELKHEKRKLAQLKTFEKNIEAKYSISTPLIIENPVKSPNVPPIIASLSTNFEEESLVT